MKDIYQEFIRIKSYARWLEEKGRRETWEETCQRTIGQIKRQCSKCGYDISKKEEILLYTYMFDYMAMPSMRMVMTAGPALEKDNAAAFNCAAVAVDNMEVPAEIMYLLMLGCGVGFSIERQYINKMPVVAEEFYNVDTVIQIKDSKVGWASAYKQLIFLLYAGQIPKWDVSKIRPAGSRLKTFGGRSSGPEPLIELFKFTVESFKQASGRKLTSIEWHDIICMIAKCIVSGGVRRSALISLSNLSDDRMRNAKSGNWYNTTKWRQYANNSAVYTERPSMDVFLNEWKALIDSKSGERGIFNRCAAKRKIEESSIRDAGYDFVPNPCSETLLRTTGGFCNLSEIIVRPNDDIEDLKEKARVCAIFGTIQSSFTDFRFLRKVWKDNAEEERLMGVSMTGIMDNFITRDICFGELQKEIKKVVEETNREWSEKLNINESVALTCIKPSGTVSQLVNSSPGIHPRMYKYFWRNVRLNKNDPLSRFMIDKGVKHVEDPNSDTDYVFRFPKESPNSAILRKNVSAYDQLKLVKYYMENWCDHSVSCTIYVKDNEWLGVGDWVYNNFDDVIGLSFLPDVSYTGMYPPFEEITKEEYEEAIKTMPKEIDWRELGEYENEDNTEGGERGCADGACALG